MSGAGGLAWLNGLGRDEAIEVFLRVCHSTTWSTCMAEALPFDSLQRVYQLAADVWESLPEEDWLEAIAGHPRIGDKDALRKKFAAAARSGAKVWESGEQSGVDEASEEVLSALKAGNDAYFEKNGFVFLICATGKSAEEMLGFLEQRLPRSREEELVTAAGEQAKITVLRLDKLFAENA